MNKLYITGRITKDIELKEYGDLKVVNNTIAVYMGKDKDNNEITYFFDFKAFNYQANKLNAHATKGSKIAIEGVLKQDIWEDDNGKHSKIIIYAENIELLAATKSDKPTDNEEDTEQDFPF